MKIAFFLHQFPVESETFVINELYNLQQAGLHGYVISEKKRSSSIHPNFAKIKYTHDPVPQFQLTPRFLIRVTLAHFFWITHHPIRYSQSLMHLFQMFTKEHLRVFLQSMEVALALKKQNCDVLYCHESDSASLYMYICKQLCQKPAGIIFHTYYLFHKNKYLKHKMTLADFIIFQSNYSKKIALKIVSDPKLNPNKVFIIPSPGVDTDFFKPIEQKKTFNSVIKLISVGRLEEAKGFSHLIEAVALLKRQGLKVTCQIIGYGSLKNSLQLLIKNLNVEKNVELVEKIGHNKKLIDMLSKADIFILPSVIDKTGVRDVHPNAIKEAMAMGLIVITSKLGGIDEIIQDQVNGLLLDEVNAVSITQKIRSALKLSKNQKKNIKELARKRIVSEYAADKTTQSLISVLNSSNQ